MIENDAPGRHTGHDSPQDSKLNDRDVRPPELREHDHYFDSEAWVVVDIDGVDRAFATNTGADEVRIDLDGVAEPSSEVGEPGDRINVSVWLDREQFASLVDKLTADTCSAPGCDVTEGLEAIRTGLVETRLACPDHRKDVLGVSS